MPYSSEDFGPNLSVCAGSTARPIQPRPASQCQCSARKDRLRSSAPAPAASRGSRASGSRAWGSRAAWGRRAWGQAQRAPPASRAWGQAPDREFRKTCKVEGLGQGSVSRNMCVCRARKSKPKRRVNAQNPPPLTRGAELVGSKIQTEKK